LSARLAATEGRFCATLRAIVPVTVHFVGPVRRPCREHSLALELASPLSVEEFLARLGYSAQEAARLTVLVNGTRAPLEAPIPEGARVEILLPVGGG